MEPYSKIEEKVIKDLRLSGWQEEDILIHQKIPSNGRLFEIDIILLYNLLPVAIVEVKPSYQSNLQDALFQALNYAEMADVPFAVLSNGEKILISNRQGRVTEVKNFPFPQDLLREVGNTLDENDPVLFPTAKTDSTQVRFHQAKAISKAIENLKSNKNVTVILPVGSGSTYVVSRVVWKTVNSGFYKRVLVLTDRVETALQTLRAINGQGANLLRTTNNIEEISLSAIQVVVINYHKIFNSTSAIKIENSFDLVILFGQFSSIILESVSDCFPTAATLVISNTRSVMSLQNDFSIAYQYSLEDAVLAEDERVPDGYKSIPLESIAEIIMGYPSRPKPANGEDGQEVSVLSGRSILEDGSIDFNETRKVLFDRRHKRSKLQPNDILVATISSNQVKIGRVPDKFKHEIFVANSIIIIRITQSSISTKDVFEYLRSPRGQTNLIRYASILSTSINRISPNQLAKMPVLIPDILGDSTKTLPLELSLTAQVRDEIEKDILPLFSKLSQDEKGESEQDSEFEYIAEKLRSVALKLSPPRTKDKILTQYPLPIAMSYRRFLDSKFNPFEQILRLRDLYEAASFFIYNVTLADLLRRLDNKKYVFNDAGTRKAYNGYSMSKRIDFIDQVIQIARQEGHKEELFVPELLEADLVTKLEHMGEFRNLISHTAAATESRQKKLVEKYEPIVEGILQSMEFISSYRLVRIPEFRFTNGRLIRRMEIYAGVVPELEEFPIPGENEIIKAESDHLVLLDQEDQVLDLFPFYQLLASDETHYETHMCFIKQRKAEQKKLIGESVQGSFEVTLDGYDTFEELQKKLQ